MTQEIKKILKLLYLLKTELRGDRNISQGELEIILDKISKIKKTTKK